MNLKHSTILISILIALFACGTAYADEYEYTPDLQYEGVVESNGLTFTWYSENILPGEGLYELNANGRTVNDGGYVVDGEGFIAVASPWGVDEIGTVIETPWGLARVYDYCEDDSYDVYTSW